MRMRFKPYAREELESCGYAYDFTREMRGKWHESFAHQQPLHLELGCGKGGFLAQLASAHPDINYLGIDMTQKVLVLAKRNIETEYSKKNLPVDNVKIATFDIERIGEMMSGEDTVQRIYINFCNPWNVKANHTKHRLTHPRQLLKYREFLADGGEIYFKCDEDGLFQDTLRYMPAAGFEIIWQTTDLHADEPEWNIRTEHEQMFTAQGIPTKALIARKIEKPNDAETVAKEIL